ncbi:MAG: hypothetical protein IT373_22715 [Polyangiaceae bacterium]|nr:hypothetical protein [Polyangiaceae bacterium]
MEFRTRIRRGCWLGAGAALAFPSAAGAQSPPPEPVATQQALVAPATAAVPAPPEPWATPPPPATPPTASSAQVLVVPGHGSWRYDPASGWQPIAGVAVPRPPEQDEDEVGPGRRDPALFGGGIAVTSLGGLALGGAAAAAMFGWIPCVLWSLSSANDGKCGLYYTAVGAAAAGGGVLLAAGIPMLVIGGAPKEEVPTAGAVPAVRLGAGSVAATWTF